MQAPRLRGGFRGLSLFVCGLREFRAAEARRAVLQRTWLG